MPKINVYLSDELADAVKEANLPVSAICQRALEHAVQRVAAVREMVLTDGDAFESDGRFSRFTTRARNVLAAAVDGARGDGVPVATGHLLAAMLAEGGNLALRVLGAMEIEPDEVAAALAARRKAPVVDACAPDGPQFGDDARAALRLTVTEATSLGHNYVGCEHLLLGLVSEPDGTAGQVLRGLGAELRLTRRAVTAALAGYVHLQVQGAASVHTHTQGAASVHTHAQGAAVAGLPTVTAAGAAPDVVATLTAAIREELRPILARLDRLEAGGADET